MAFSALGMGFLFTAKDLATAKIRHLQTNVGKLAKESEAASIKYERSMKRIKSGAMMVGGGVVGLLAINKASKAFETFEKNLVSAGSIMGATAEEMKALKEAGIQAGIATQFSPAEAVQGLENLGAAGMNAQQSISTLNSVLGLASASLGQLGVADSASVVVGVLNAFGETTDMAAKRVDQLVQVTKKSNFQARDFSIALSQASAQAKAADQSFESMLATLGLLRNTNLDASSSATAYREAVRRLSGDKLAQKKLSELNVDTLDKETGKIKDLAKIVLELQPKIAKLNAKERNLALTKMFGVRGMKTYNAIMAGYHKLVKEGKVQVGDYAGAHTLLMKSLEDSEGAMAKSRDAYLQTAAGQRVLLKGSWETFQVIAGETFTPVLLPALQGTISMLNKLIAIVKDIPAPIKTMVAQFAGFSSVALLAVGSMRLLSGAMGLFSMSGAAGRWLETQSKLGEGMDAAGKKSKKLAGSTGRLAKVNATLSRGLSGLGRALPFIGIAAAGIASIYNMIKADEKAVEEYRQKRAEFEKKLAMQTASDYGRIEAAAQRTKAAALEASEALVRKTQAHKGLARVNLVKLEKEVLKAVMKRKSLMNELANGQASRENQGSDANPWRATQSRGDNPGEQVGGCASSWSGLREPASIHEGCREAKAADRKGCRWPRSPRALPVAADLDGGKEEGDSREGWFVARRTGARSQYQEAAKTTRDREASGGSARRGRWCSRPEGAAQDGDARSEDRPGKCVSIRNRGTAQPHHASRHHGQHSGRDEPI